MDKRTVEARKKVGSVTCGLMYPQHLCLLQVGEVHVVESVRRNRVTGSLIGSDGSASMHGEHVELYSEEESSTGEEEEEEEEEEEVVVETYDLPESIENRPPTAGTLPLLQFVEDNKQDLVISKK